MKLLSLILLTATVSANFNSSALLANSTKTATFKAYCKQAYFAPSIDGDGDIEWFFTSYDGSSRVPPPYDGNGLVNGELKQQSPNSSVFLMDWISPSYAEQYFYGNSLSWAFYNPDNYGTVSLNISSTDSDGNGVVDWMQKDRSANESFSGQLVVHTMNNTTASVSGSIYRNQDSGSGQYSITYSVPGETGTSWGDWVVGYYEGSFVYDGSNCEIDATTMDAQGSVRNVSGSSSYNAANEDQVTINTLDLQVNSSEVRINGNTLTRNGNVYSASVQAVDGGTASSWADFQDWYLEITDPNDSDSDGIPDLSDTLIDNSNSNLQSEYKNIDSSKTTIENGWSYHVWPWVYNNALENWLYYAHSVNLGIMVWSNDDKFWYFWNSTSNAWQKI